MITACARIMLEHLSGGASMKRRIKRRREKRGEKREEKKGRRKKGGEENKSRRKKYASRGIEPGPSTCMVSNPGL